MRKKYKCIYPGKVPGKDYFPVHFLKEGEIYEGEQQGGDPEMLNIWTRGKEHYGISKTRFQEVGEGKKIIGYKCPQNLYNGHLKEGTILESSEHFEYLYKGGAFDCYLPKELVESWEPVYEEEKLVKMEIGKPKVPITIHENGNIEQSGKHPFLTNISEIKDMSTCLRNSKLKIKEYPVTIRSVWIGCPNEGVEVTISELLDIEINYNKLTNK